jgi:hypothetical protein
VFSRGKVEEKWRKKKRLFRDTKSFKSNPPQAHTWGGAYFMPKALNRVQAYYTYYSDPKTYNRFTTIGST